MTKQLRIAILGPVWYPVPPDIYGGIEWVVAMLADGLTDLGHDVTLFASGDSRTKARLVSVFERAPSDLFGHSLTELHHALSCFERTTDFDVINDHSGPLAASIGGAVRVPVVHSVHLPIEDRLADVYEQIARSFPNVALTSISFSQRIPKPDLPWIANCPNAVDLSAYPFVDYRGDYLLFLGRMSADKGAHRAIEVSREAGLSLKLAGKQRSPSERAYFAEFVEPELDERTEYLGEVSHAEKIHLLQHARATLFPISWEEPFGLVMIESMACGTPVIATRRGAVPEVIEDGRCGLIVDDHRQMSAALARADLIDSAECRRYVEERFSPERMVDAYIDAYTRALFRT